MSKEQVAKVWLNGVEADTIDILDRGLSYGDGFFSSLCLKEGVLQLLSLHLQRIRKASNRLQLPLNEEYLKSMLEDFIQGEKQGVVKVMVTRPFERRGFHWGSNSGSNIILQFFPADSDEQIDAKRNIGVPVYICKHPLSVNPKTAGLKHLNRLDQVLARSEQEQSKFSEGLMLDVNGSVVEGTMTNLFICMDGRLLTPDLTDSGVEGVMRRYILERAQDLDIDVEIRKVSVEDLISAKHIFLTNALIGYWQVCKIDGRAWQAETGVPKFWQSLNIPQYVN